MATSTSSDVAQKQPEMSSSSHAVPSGEEAQGGIKEISKRAADKAAKKAAKAAKKAEYALRPKQAASSAAGGAPVKASDSTTTATTTTNNAFVEGWLKRVYEEKPTSVCTRFPPEPNGYLHIGHAKAIMVNFGFAKHHGGICYLRFDDTNPEKEEDIYFRSIKELVAWLGYTPYAITHSSDYFARLYDLAEEMIRRDRAYVCHCTKEETNLQRGGPDNRGARLACLHRTRPTQESLVEFRAMRDGKYQPGQAHLRMKQRLTDPIEGNPQMWDLAAYRVLNKSHPRTADTWKIYPTYDFTHCLCDAFEEITHSLCTTEFYLSRTSYDWLLEVLDMKLEKSDEKGPMQREYGRLKLEGTILSKRRITALVEGATFEITKPDRSLQTITVPPAVRGWDDPRLYTLVGIRRRGVPAGAILSFVSELGVTDANTVIRANKFEQSIRKYLERTVPRLMLVLSPIKIVIEDLADDYLEELRIPLDPKNPAGDSRIVPFTKVIYIDRTDFQLVDSPNFFRLALGKTVGLLNVPFCITASTASATDDGTVTEIRASMVHGVKPKAYIHWVGSKGSIRVTARQYNALFNVDDANELDWKTGGYASALNSNSEVVYKDALLESACQTIKTSSQHNSDSATDDLVRFQAVRTGYFCLDPDSKPDELILNQIVSLKEDSSKGK